MESKNAHQLKTKRTNLMLQLGELVYHQIRSKSNINSQTILEISKEVTNIDKEIAQDMNLNGHDLTQCPSCNNSVDENTAFCSNCGFSLKEHKAKYTGTCSCCNAQTEDEQNFCDICGTLLK